MSKEETYFECLTNEMNGRDMMSPVLVTYFTPEQTRAAHKAMELYAKEKSIEFFKWNALKASEYLDYLRRVDKAEGVSEKELELNNFENATIEKRYNLFINQQQKL